MTVRLYLPYNAVSAPITPNLAGQGFTLGSNHFFQSAVLFADRPYSASSNQTDASVSYDALMGTYVYGPLEAQTIYINDATVGDYWSGYLRVAESSRSANAMLEFMVSVWSNDGSTMRGYYMWSGTNEWVLTTLTNRKIGAYGSAASISAQSGDYLVFSIGWSANTYTSYTHTIQFGDAYGELYDLPANETNTADGTPWVEYAGTITVQSTPNPPEDVAVLENASGNPVISWSPPSSGPTPTSYKVQRTFLAGINGTLSGVNSWTNAATGVTDTEYEDTGAGNRDSYVYQVLATNANGDSDPSSPWETGIVQRSA